MRAKGKIVSWNDDKGYGFIAPAGGGDKVFVHITAFRNRNNRPGVDDIVSYDVSQDERGRLRASNATRPRDKLSGAGAHSGAIVAVILSIVFFLALGRSVLAGSLPDFVLTIYAAASTLTFLAYALDKHAARTGRWRTSESALHLLALVGGWPGAWVAQKTLRHKSRKVSFRIVFWLTVIVNCAGLAWLHTPAGKAEVERFLGSTITTYGLAADHTYSAIAG
jgi:uncharacterized membrane protein YsdA (DUF1294 family)/cold shock CspA family protein